MSPPIYPNPAFVPWAFCFSGTTYAYGSHTNKKKGSENIINIYKTNTALSLAGLLALMAGAAQASTIATVPLAQAGASFTFNSATGQLSGVSLGANPGVEGDADAPAGDHARQHGHRQHARVLLVRADHRDHPGRERRGRLQWRQLSPSSASDAAYTTVGTPLLTGTFGPSELLGFGTGATLIDFGNVTYTGGSDLAAFLAANGGSSATGTFTVGMTGLSPGIPFFLNAPSFPDFTAQGSTATFDAHSAAVPETGHVRSSPGRPRPPGADACTRKARRCTA